MFKSVNINIDWSGPHKAKDAFDPSAPLAIGFGWPGVYIQITRCRTGDVTATYIGKHTQSVIERQWEHFQNLVDGKYHLFDQNGSHTFVARSKMPSNFIEILVDHVEITEVFFGKLSHLPSGPVANWVGATESILQRSPSWKKNGGIILNSRNESPVYQMHDQFEVIHSGAKEPLRIFGGATTWDRRKRAVT